MIDYLCSFSGDIVEIMLGHRNHRGNMVWFGENWTRTVESVHLKKVVMAH